MNFSLLKNKELSVNIFISELVDRFIQFILYMNSREIIIIKLINIKFIIFIFNLKKNISLEAILVT